MSYVLVVEDDPLGADAARSFLASLGHSVHVVPTPEAAARLMVWSRPHVVLADRCLPPYDDHLLQAACDRLTVPLIDLASAICLLGRDEQRPAYARFEPLSAAG
jgi:CheY-like chemotaxis protein